MIQSISKKSLVGMLVAAIMCVALLVVAIPQDAYAAQGWNKDSKGHWYEYNSSGHYYKNGWQQIDGEWYYFESSGYSKAGWIKEGKYWYYLCDPHYAPNNGPRMAHDAAEYDGSKWYYFDSSGRMVTSESWKQYNTGWIYVASSGEVACNCWLSYGGKWYRFGDDNTWATNLSVVSYGGFRVVDGKVYYFDMSTTAMKTGWQKYKGYWYYFASSGAMQTGWQKISGKWYFFDKADGAMASGEWREGYLLNGDGTWTYPHKGSWHKNSKGWWFGDESGWYAKNTSQWIDGKKYNFNSAGYCTNP